MKKETYQREQERGARRFYADLRAKAKRANQRLVRLERMDVMSPAYQAVQAKLEILGRQTAGDRGRRFSETGKATYNEMEIMNKILDQFLSMETSTQKGAASWVNDVWQGALDSDKGLMIKEAGITKEEWLDFWSNMPANKKDRMFASEQIVKMLRTYTKKNEELADEQKMSMSEIADAISSANNITEGYKNLGMTYQEAAVIDRRLND